MIFLPHTNTVILLEPYCGTITEPGLPVPVLGIKILTSCNTEASSCGHCLLLVKRFFDCFDLVF